MVLQQQCLPTVGCGRVCKLPKTQIPKHPIVTTRCRTPRENRFDDETTAHPPHTRGTFHRRLQPLYKEKHKVSCSGFLPNTSPTQDSCSHYNAICNLRCNKRKELRAHEQPHVAEHPFVTTSLGTTLRSSPLPFATASLGHRFPWSSLPWVHTSISPHTTLRACIVL